MDKTAVIIQRHLGEIKEAELKEAIGAKPLILLSGDNGEAGFTLNAATAYDWGIFRQRVEREHEERMSLLPRIANGAGVYYAGLSPIPCALYAGYLWGGLHPVNVLQRNHNTKKWNWPGAGAAVPKLVKKLPEQANPAAGDVAILLSVSHQVRMESVEEALPNRVFDVEIGIENPAEDALETAEQLEEVANLFKEALDTIIRNLPRVNRIHLFASIPCGLAFRLGTKINPTMHPPLQSYQFVDGCCYRAAIEISDKATDVNYPSVTQGAMSEFISLCDQELRKLQRYAKLTYEECKGSKDWREQFRINTPFREPDGDFASLPLLYDTGICDTSVSLAEEGRAFFDRDGKSWNFSPDIIALLKHNFPEDQRLRMAVRMFIMHEALHPYQGVDLV